MARYHFNRYINGTLMAEGVLIETASSLPEAMSKAARLAKRGPKGETPVLVFIPDRDCDD